MSMPRPSKPIVGATAVVALAVFLWSAVHPREPVTWLLEVFPVLIAVPILLATARRFPLTTLAYVLIGCHAMILMVGGRYTYAQVPLFNALRDALHLARNPYDRVGHFFQGFVPALLAREILLRRTALARGKMLAFLCLACVMFVSSCYELIEWAVAEATGEAAESFLGTQGDPWDTQWDMFMALIGGCVALATLPWLHDRQLGEQDSVTP
jgi:putative membrane protein